jgi:uncharacterized protein
MLRALSPSETGIARWFHWIIDHRWIAGAGSLAVIATLASFLPGLIKDTTPEAFVPKDSPALEYRDHVQEVFGLKDPMVVAIIGDRPERAFTPDGLHLVQWLSERIQRVPGVDPERVVSLATENDIIGAPDGLRVESFWKTPPAEGAGARAVWQAIQDFPLLLGTLVARDGSGTLIVAELLDDTAARRIYFDLLDLVEQARADGLVLPDISVHVAGQGAVSGYLSAYIDADAARLNPIAALVITLVLLIAFRTLAGALLPNVVVIASVAVGLGAMAAAGVPFYVITNSLPVILIGIAVCDSIHILSQYYEEIARHPDISARDATVRAMTEMVRPVTLTTLTTAAGFIGLAAAAGLPPMRAYGLFAALGIVGAWLWTMVLLPVALSFWRPQAATALRPGKDASGDVFTRLMARFGAAVAARPQQMLIFGAILLIAAGSGALRVEFNDQRINSFHASEPLRLADAAINAAFDGTYYLDVAVTTPEPEDLFRPENLQRIEHLQRWMEREGGVVNTTSIVDYIKQMHRAMHEDRPEYHAIPDDPALIAQYFLLYAASGEPTDFQEEVDYDYRLAHVRGRLRDDNFRHVEPIVLGLERYLVDEFNSVAIEGHATGALHLSYSWIAPLARNTAQGVALALLLVFAAAAVFFRSLTLGLLATMPVAFAVLMVFGVMGHLNIWIGVGTSMFAAIAIGLGVDFAIHTLDRLRTLIRNQGQTYEAAAAQLFPTTGRALLFNLLALTCGFGVLMTSKVPPLQHFGLLVVVALVTSFLISLTVLPAAVARLRPRALFPACERPESAGAVPAAGGLNRARLLAVLVVLSVPAAWALAALARADVLPDADTVMRAVDARPEGETQRATIVFELTDRRGKTRRQETVSLRRYYGDDKKQVLFYLEPSNVRGTGFLTYDYADPAREDDQWLYLPALRKSRRISASERGEYFLGTDLTYEDIKRQGKVTLTDWQFRTIGREPVDGLDAVVIEGLPASEAIGAELGYGRAIWHVNPANHTILRSDTWDLQGNPQKTARFVDIRPVEDIWTTHEIVVTNHKTGHRTHLRISDVDYGVEVDDSTFAERALHRGPRQ